MGMSLSLEVFVLLIIIHPAHMHAKTMTKDSERGCCCGELAPQLQGSYIGMLMKVLF